MVKRSMPGKTPAPHHFRCHSLKDWRIYLHPEFPHELADLAAVDSPAFRQAEFSEVAASPFAKVYRGTVEAAGRRYCLYLKQYLYRSPIDVAKHFVRESRAMRSFKAAALLSERGLCCPLVIAVGLRRPLGGIPLLDKLPFCSASTTLTLGVAGAAPLHDYWWHRLETRTRKWAFLEALGTEIGYMHSQRIVHGDLRSGNIHGEETAEGWRFILLDNERTKRLRRLPRALIVKNLVQIPLFIRDVSQTDRGRFFRAYLRQHPLSRRQQLSLVRDISEKSAQRESERSRRLSSRLGERVGAPG